jgi:hypothetical protein
MTYHTFQLLWLALVVVLGWFAFRHRHEWVVEDFLHMRCKGCGKIRHVREKTCQNKS